MTLSSTAVLFWGGAIALVAIALAFVLPPLLRSRKAAGAAGRRDINIAVYRDQMRELEADRGSGLIPEDQYQAARQELELRLADDALAPESSPEPAAANSRGLGYTLAVALPLAAFGLYVWLGNPTAMDAPVPTAMADGDGAHDVTAMVRKVEERARANPDDAQAWEVLARTYAALERWADSQQAYAQALRLRPDTPALMTGLAEVLAVAGNGNLKGRPMELVLRALEIDPNDPKGLELAGLNAFQEANFAQAAYYFKRLHALLPPESEFARDVLAARQEAERRAHAAMSGLDSLAAPPAAKAPAASAGWIEGRVELSPALRANVGPDDTVFLFARAPQGGAPVAALRASAAKLPLDFRLDDSMAMSPANALSGQQQVTLVARVSRSGDATARPGDLEGRLADVKVGVSDVRIVIDRALP